MTATSPDHNYGIAHTLLGRKPRRPDDLFVGPQDHPSLGAILHKLRGESGILPPWVMLPRPFTTLSPPHKGQSAGFLGPAFEPVTLNEPQKDSLAPKDLKFDAFSLPPTISADRLDARRALLAAGEDTLAGTPECRRWQSTYANAAHAYERCLPRRLRPDSRAGPRARSLRPPRVRAEFPAGPSPDRVGRTIRQRVLDVLRRERLPVQLVGQPRRNYQHLWRRRHPARADRC